MNSDELLFSKDQTWDSFRKEIIGKKIYIYGAGAGSGILWERMERPVYLSGVIDNDKRKQGKALEDLYPVDCKKLGNSIINSEQILDRVEREKAVFLIASQRHYAEISGRLYEMGFRNIFILSKMEEYYSKINGESGKKNEDKKYIEKYTQERIKENKILFIGFGTYSGHGKYITEAILSNRKDIDIVWAVSDLDEIVPEGVRIVLWTNPRNYICELETARIVIYDNIIPEYTVKRYGQIHIFTKHWASITLKKFYLDASTIIDIPQNVNKWRKIFGMLDYVITGSDFDENSCRRGFEFSGEFIRVGSPRSDAMFRTNEMRKRITRKYGISADYKLLVYAPTYRYKTGANGEHIQVLGKIDIDFAKLRRSVTKRFGGKWIILLRLHPGVAEDAYDVERNRFVINVSSHQDGEEIVAASDILISDYSSIMFEPAFVKKPVFLYAPDRERYIDHEYDLLIDYDSLPFPIAETNDQLMENIMNFDQEKYEADVTAFLDKYGVHEDGHASERAAEFILGLLG